MVVSAFCSRLLLLLYDNFICCEIDNTSAYFGAKPKLREFLLSNGPVGVFLSFFTGRAVAYFIIVSLLERSLRQLARNIFASVDLTLCFRNKQMLWAMTCSRLLSCS